MGRDHTIYAKQAGYVKYYLDPEKHPKRKYIGVVFERDQKLPLPRNSVRRRRLGLIATVTSEEPQVELGDNLTLGGSEVSGLQQQPAGSNLKGPWKHEQLEIRPGYMYRESNWQIGRTAERAGVKVKPFKPGDRWAAWRKATARKARSAERRGMRGGGKR
jgi:large subunit ribosomal protein L27